MYPIPADLDLSPLVGNFLTAISIAKYQLTLDFSRPGWPGGHAGTISCEGEVRIEIGGESRLVYSPDCWHDVSLLPKIAGRDVTAWSIVGSHEFSLALADDGVIRFRSEERGYEDFSIWIGEREWVI